MTGLWERVRKNIPFIDVVSELIGYREKVIRCPFHGMDRKPSFTLYSKGNDATCFGCPPGENYFDSVIFVSKYNQVSRVQALRWLEHTFNLPRMSDVQVDDDEGEDEPEYLSFEDLEEAFNSQRLRRCTARQGPGVG